MTDETHAPSALEAPWVQGILRRRRRSGWLCLATGLALFIAVGTFANVFVGGSQRLRDEGQQTQGVIVGRSALSMKNGTLTSLKDGTATVDYVVDDRHHQRAVALGNKARRYSEGQHVTVYYDADEPDRMTIDDVDNEPAWTVLPMAIGFVASITLLLAGVVILVRRRSTRRLLRASTWHDGAPILGLRGTSLFLEDPENQLVRATVASRTPEPSRVRIAGGQNRLLIALGDEPSTLIRARRPRSEAQEKQWRKLLASPSRDPGPATR